MSFLKCYNQTIAFIMHKQSQIILQFNVIKLLNKDLKVKSATQPKHNTYSKGGNTKNHNSITHY